MTHLGARSVDLVAVLMIALGGGANDALAAKRPLDTLECARCHDTPSAAPVSDERSCVRCHQQIRAGTLPDVDAETLARWRTRIVHLTAVPALAHLDGRVRRSWIAAFLQNPDVRLRPGLSERMPRLPIDAPLARDIARQLVPHVPDERPLAWPAAATVDAGRALFAAKGCVVCHAFESGAIAQATAPTAPDLRHARARMPARAIDAWLREPRGAMPLVALTDDERLALVRFLLEAALPAPTTLPPAVRLPLLARPVRFDEVNERVFRHSCWHCHSDASLARGDGGPGNTGGFGYRGRGLSFASYGEANQGSVGDDGQRRSIFQPVSAVDRTPRLVAHLLARQAEERGAAVPGVLGMPLGLPSVTPEELQLVESWLAQGRPR